MFALAGALCGQTPRESVRKLLEVSGAMEMAKDSMTAPRMEAQMRDMLKPDQAPPDRRPTLERFIKEFSVAFAAEAAKKQPELIELVLDVYDKFYTPEEIKALVAFYETPVGRKMALTAPKANMEIMRISVAWGQTLGQKLGAEIGARIEAEEKARKP